jgi:hypothetical protein
MIATTFQYLTANTDRFRLLATLVTLVAVFNCSGCGDGKPARSPVSGTVSYNGTTLQIGSLVFVPTGGGPAAQGEIDRNGKYVMGTYANADGVIPGQYKVMITALTSPGGSGLAEDSVNGNAGPVSVIPELYGDLEKSGLTASVESGKSNTIDFLLTDK